ncbi:MAG: LURP-one-related/scramblase family protein [Microthrixaceae bacterium]
MEPWGPLGTLEAMSNDTATTTELLIHRRLASLDGFTVQTPDGSTAWTVKYHVGLGKGTWTFLDPAGATAATLVRPAMHVHPTFELDRPGHPTVTIRKANFMPLNETWRIEGDTDGDLDVTGDVVDHEFTITDASGTAVAQASRSWVTVRETYGVRCNGIDPVVAAATSVAIDVVEHQQR